MSKCPSPAEKCLAFRLLVAFIASLGCTMLARPVACQIPLGHSGSPSKSGEGLSEIVVTAQRREENIQQTPISVTAFTGQQLTEFGVRNFVDYAKSVPNLSFGMGGQSIRRSGLWVFIDPPDSDPRRSGSKHDQLVY
jgi:hypothetical protein